MFALLAGRCHPEGQKLELVVDRLIFQLVPRAPRIQTSGGLASASTVCRTRRRIALGCRYLVTLRPAVALRPEISRCRQRINFLSLPPSQFIARRVEVPVVERANRHGKFIRDLAAERTWLGKLQVVRLAGLPPADEAGLAGDKAEVILVAQPLGLGDGEAALIDGLPLRPDWRINWSSTSGKSHRKNVRHPGRWLRPSWCICRGGNGQFGRG